MFLPTFTEFPSFRAPGALEISRIKHSCLIAIFKNMVLKFIADCKKGIHLWKVRFSCFFLLPALSLSLSLFLSLSHLINHILVRVLYPYFSNVLIVYSQDVSSTQLWDWEICFHPMTTRFAHLLSLFPTCNRNTKIKRRDCIWRKKFQQKCSATCVTEDPFYLETKVKTTKYRHVWWLKLYTKLFCRK